MTTTKNEKLVKTITATEVAKWYPYAVVRLLDEDGSKTYVHSMHESYEEAQEELDRLGMMSYWTFEVRAIEVPTSDSCDRHISELEEENRKMRECAKLMAETMSKPKPVSLLDGGPEVSDRLDVQLQKFEAGLRHACHLAYQLQHDLADEGHVVYRADGTACWAYGSKRMKNVSDELAGIIEHYFGGFNYPTD